MKQFFAFISILTFIFAFTLASTLARAGQWNEVNSPDQTYMNGSPNYNQNYYNPEYNQQASTPNYDSDYYNKQHNYNGNYQRQEDSTPHGNDIRDYNPYYDRYGNLK